MHITRAQLKSEKGFAALVTVVIIAFAALLIAMGAAFLGIGELDLGYTSWKGQAAFERADGCIEEALEQLRKDETYSTEATTTISFSDGSCAIHVAQSGSTRTINAIGVVNGPIYDYEKRIQTTATVIGNVVTLTTWQEI